MLFPLLVESATSPIITFIRGSSFVTLGIVLFFLFFFQLNGSFSTQETPPSLPEKEVLGPSPKIAALFLPEIKRQDLPVRLQIPRLKIDTNIEYVGLTSSRDMGAPTGPTQVAWFKLGPRPGEEGNAVIAGHRGWKDGKVAVFDRLNTLRKGDTVTVKDDKGKLLTFGVRETRIYDPGADATAVFGSDQGIHLNLISCTGSWDISKKSYSKRLAVFTDLISAY